MNSTYIEVYYRDEEQSARLAGLRYTSDAMPGYLRKRNGKGFVYFDPEGKKIDSQKMEKFFSTLSIPPAWNGVWISPEKNSHLLATGIDEKGRKQYIYHERWRKIRDLLNSYRMIHFGESLPQIRRKINNDLSQESLTKEKVIATILTIMDKTFIRLGAEAYARENESYGLSTLKDRHVKKEKEKVIFHFLGKSQKEHEIELRDRRIAEIVMKCRDLPGSKLFQYYDETGAVCGVKSEDVNEYLKNSIEHDFTAKDFRTWGGTLAAFRFVKKYIEMYEKPTKLLSGAVKAASQKLGNTPAVAKKSYIHPRLISCIRDNSFNKFYVPTKKKGSEYCSRDELELIAVLRCMLSNEVESEGFIANMKNNNKNKTFRI